MEDGETGEADEAVGSTFRQFGQEEAFGGHRSRASAQEETEEDGKEIVDGGGVSDGGCGCAGREWVEAAHLAKATELQNYLLQQLVVALGGGATLFGKLPAEGKLATEDEADGSEEEADGSYKTGESLEEESGEESGEGPEE